MNSLPAPCQVFSTPELLEEILLCVDDIGTLVASVPLVCKAWNQHVSESPALQRALFFLPDNSKALSDEDAEADFVVNPLLRKHFGALISEPTEFDPDVPWTRQSRAAREGFDIKEVKKMRLSITRGDGNQPDKRFACKEASWRRMLISQPPIRTVGYLPINRAFDQVTHPLERINLPEGLRMGQLWDTIYHALWTSHQDDVERRTIRMTWRLGTGSRLRWSRTIGSLSRVPSSLTDVDLFFQTIEFNLWPTDEEAHRPSRRKEKAKWDRWQSYDRSRFYSEGYDEQRVFPNETQGKEYFEEWYQDFNQPRDTI
ncbi:unnamed protein product [Clonostachys solani]|uniref:F-box domain-containing protein n=1 Tax=Clonostachys solani TaxID=160281 RepID=A0A9N9WAG8_9HYPO|nr:unnamed protein product [Clonostachys solani]